MWAKKMTSSDHWRTSWACRTEPGMRAEHAEGLVADLPAVAVRAVQQVPAPSLPDAGDVGELVADAGRQQDAARGQRAAAGEADGEAGLDVDDPVAR